MNCNVIKDILPLYVDQCCSEESAKLVEEHLANCTDCRSVYECMRRCCAPQQIVVQPDVKLHKVDGWKASVLQSAMVFVAFAMLTLGVILEGNTPTGEMNGLWAVALIVPATGYLLSMAHWFLIRIYKSRKMFSVCSCLATFVMTVAGYVWAAIHYADGMSMNQPLVWMGALLSVGFCALSGVLANRFALLLGKE